MDDVEADTPVVRTIGLLMLLLLLLLLLQGSGCGACVDIFGCVLVVGWPRPLLQRAKNTHLALA